MGANIMMGFAQVLDLICKMFQVVIVASVVISWLDAPPNNPIVQMIRTVTEPVFRPFRRLTKNWGGPFDLAPMIVWLLIITFQIVVIKNVMMAPRL